ncbi:MAG: tRNA pseudouridine(55) synthase TruB [Myxococcaceae bacterium]
MNSAKPTSTRPPGPGVWLTHKPLGETSFSAFGRFMGGHKPKLGACHGGTLDPFAEGLLVILVGPATRLMPFLHEAPKTYVADVVWGRETDTGDAGGVTVATQSTTALSQQKLDEALHTFLGWTEQTPPTTSAKKVRGEPAYRRVHRGESVSLSPSRVYLHAARWLSHDLPERSRLELTCRGGFYVRALARDLGRLLGCGAHLVTLSRTHIGPWEDPGLGRRVRLRGADMLPWAASREVTPTERATLKGRRSIPREGATPPLWNVPKGYPPPETPSLGTRAGQVFALLDEADGRLESRVWLSPPV